MCDKGRFQNFGFLATSHQKNAAIVIIIYTTTHVQILSPFGPNLVEIFEVVKRWVVVDVWVGDSTRFIYIIEVALKLLLNHRNPNTAVLGCD